jgi:hypothetical protein
VSEVKKAEAGGQRSEAKGQKPLIPDSSDFRFAAARLYQAADNLRGRS